MGLFSGKKKTVVSTAVVRVVDDAQVPDTAKSSVLRGVLGDENIAEHLVEGILGSMAIKGERFFRYARDKYTYGLPKGSVETAIQGQDVVEQVIESELGAPISVTYFKYAALNSIHIGWKKLVGEYGYNSLTNELEVLSAREGVPVYLSDMVAVYTTTTFEGAEPGDLDQWGDSASSGYTPARPIGALSSVWKYAANTPYVVDPAAERDYVEVLYTFEVEIEEVVDKLVVKTKTLREGVMTLDLEGLDEEPLYYHVRYLDESGRANYWTYAEGTETYPEVEAIHRTEYSGIGTYFPFTYFRLNKVNQAHESYKEREEYKTTKKMLSFLDMDYESLSNSIHENPGIDDIEQALMIWAVPAKTENEHERKYLFEYFNLLYYTSSSPYELSGKATDAIKGFNTRGSQAILIQDAKYTMALNYQGIGKRRVAGTIGTGKVGKHDSFYGRDTYTETYTRRGQGREREKVTRTITTPYFSYRKQVNATFYEEVRVYNPQLTYTIWRGKNVVASGESPNLLIPLDHSITRLFSALQKEQLYARSLHFVMNTRITTKEKWYQTSFFKIVMIVVAVVLTILYPPGGALMWSSIAAMGAAVYIAVMVVVSLVIQFAVTKLVTFVAKALGAELTLLLAIALIAYAGYRALSTGTPLLQASANIYVSLGTNLVRGAGTEYFRSEAAILNKKTGEFELLADTQSKELEEAKKLLDVDSNINPYEFIGYSPMIIWGEDPESLYARTVESGNIGAASLASVKYYVDIALSLPKVNPTLEPTEIS